MSKYILISTPHTEFGELLQLTLEENSEFEITLVDSGTLALEKALENKYDLIILDTAISDKSFLPFAKEIQDGNPACKLVVVMPQNEANLPDMNTLHVDGFLSRPSYPSDLLKMVDDLIGGNQPKPQVNNIEKAQDKPGYSLEDMMKNFASMTIEDSIEEEHSNQIDMPEKVSAGDKSLIPGASGDITPPSSMTEVTVKTLHETGGTGVLPESQEEILPEGASSEYIETTPFPNTEALIAEASAPKADVSVDEDEFAKELAALTETYKLEKGKKSPVDTRIPHLDISIKSPFMENKPTEPSQNEFIPQAEVEKELSESGFIPFSTNQELSTGYPGNPKESNDTRKEISDKSAQQSISEMVPEIQIIENEISSLEIELDAARSTWNEIKQAERSSINFGTKGHGDQELSGKHAELSERYKRLAREYQELSSEHEILAKEHARIAAQKTSLSHQRVEEESLAGNLFDLIAKLIPGTDAQAILVVKNTRVLGCAGEPGETALLELASLLSRDWEKDGRGDLVRFVDLTSGKLEYLVYSSVLKNDFILGLAFDAAIPLSKMRASSTRIARELSRSEVIGLMEKISYRMDVEKTGTSTEILETEEFPATVSETTTADTNDSPKTGEMMRIPIEEDIEESDLPAESIIELEAQPGFEKSLQAEIDNLLQNGEDSFEEQQVGLPEINGPSSFAPKAITDQQIIENPVTQAFDEQEPSIPPVVPSRTISNIPDQHEVHEKPSRSRGRPGKKKGVSTVMQVETPRPEEPVEDAPFIKLETIESLSTPVESESADEDTEAADILSRVRDQLNNQLAPLNDNEDDNELPGWYQEISVLTGEQGAETGPDALQNSTQTEITSAAQSPEALPGDILQDVFNQLDAEIKPEDEEPVQPDIGLFNPYQEEISTPVHADRVEATIQETVSIDEGNAGDKKGTCHESWFEAVNQPGLDDASGEEEIIYPWEERLASQSNHNDDHPTRPVRVWENAGETTETTSGVTNRADAHDEAVYAWQTEDDDEGTASHPISQNVRTQETEPEIEINNEKAAHVPNIKDSDDEDFTPVVKGSEETPSAAGLQDGGSATQTRMANRARNKLAYTCILVPRNEDQPIDEEVAGELNDALQDTASKLGWELQKVQVSPDNMLWTVEVMPTVSPGNLVRIVRQRTSRKIFARYPKFKELIPADDFWAPGFLVVSGSEPPPANSLSDFIQQTRKRQKLINALIS